MASSSGGGETPDERSASSVDVVKLRPLQITPESFAPYGQVLGPTPDGQLYGPDDAQLELSKGIPRFYIMRLSGRTLAFDRITHHASVTQCLGSAGARPWYLGVAAPGIVDTGGVLSKCGHRYTPPLPSSVQVFRVDGPQFLKLHVGTWHAGPLFTDPVMDFYNLELSDTNEVDHSIHIFSKHDGVSFQIVEE